ncbi:MAG: acyltransferase [bacterium]|nr:acyltransferase [bacterium]
MLFITVILLLTLLFTRQSSRTADHFGPAVTNQLKGFAILAVVLGHIGYFLAPDPSFLYPLSILAGVGVNLFLFLSGFGLTSSQQAKPLTPSAFYRKRLPKLYLPLWLVITALFVLDYFILRRSYPLTEIIHSYLGYFPRADLTQSLDSPLWYFTFILTYYLIFPLLWFKKRPELTALLIGLISYSMLMLKLPLNPDVQYLYRLHWLAFPLGMLFALYINKIHFRPRKMIKWIILAASTAIFAYTAVHSNVGAAPWREQLTSLVTAASLLIIFALGRFNFRLLSVFGLFSYEIYLIHWPLLSRYRLFYRPDPTYLGTVLYLLLFLAIGYLIKKGPGLIARNPKD